MPSTYGFHANDKTRCTGFLDVACPRFIMSEDTDWLGPGMYFWENLANARWWSLKKQREGIREVWIVKATIDTDNLLDTLDGDINKAIDNLWKTVEMKLRQARRPVPTALGTRFKVLFAVAKDELSRYTVIKASTVYPTRPGFVFTRGSKIETRVSIIYCVLKETAITSRERVMDHD